MQHDNLIGRGPRARKLRVRAPRTLQPRLNIVRCIVIFRPFWLLAAETVTDSTARRLARADDLGLRGNVVQCLSFWMPEREKHVHDRDQAEEELMLGSTQMPTG